MRQVNDAGLTIIKRSEGFRKDVYIDLAGFSTVGYGHKLLPGESYPNGVTPEEAEALLRKDCGKAEKIVAYFVKVPITDNMFSALVSFTYNLGSGALYSSTLLRKLNAGDYTGAAQEFPKWIYAGGARRTGLIIRRALEQALFCNYF